MRNIPKNRYLKVPDRTDGSKFFEAKFVYFFHATSGIPFRVLATFGHSRSVSDKLQTMSGLSGVPKDTHKSPKIVCRLANSFRGVFQTWKDTDHRRCQARRG